jgi:hypothetical protein
VGSFRGFVGGLLGKCGKSGVDSLVMDFQYMQKREWVNVVGGKYGYHWIFRQCHGTLLMFWWGLCESGRMISVSSGSLKDEHKN